MRNSWLSLLLNGICLLLVSQLPAQVFREDQPLFSESPFFHEAWISQHNIREIRGAVSFKRDQYPIQSSNQFYDYLFDKNGRLIRLRSTFRILDRMDTTYTYFFYNSTGVVSKVVKSDAYGFYALNYDYNDQGHQVRVFHSRESELVPATGIFNREEIVWKDSIYHLIDPAYIKSTYYNNIGRPYKEELQSFDKEGRLISRKHRNLIGDEVSSWYFNWNEKGRLSSILEKPAFSNNEEIRKVFIYDEQNRLEKEIIEKDGEEFSTRKISYDQQGLVDFQLLRNRETHLMEIVEYQYVFY